MKITTVLVQSGNKFIYLAIIKYTEKLLFNISLKFMEQTRTEDKYLNK